IEVPDSLLTRVETLADVVVAVARQVVDVIGVNETQHRTPTGKIVVEGIPGIEVTRPELRHEFNEVRLGMRVRGAGRELALVTDVSLEDAVHHVRGALFRLQDIAVL